MFSVAQRCTAQLELPAALYEDEDISGDSLPMAVAGAWQPCRAAVLAAFFECEESEVILNAADAFQCLDAMACADGINPIVICEKAIFVLHADGRLRQLVWHRRRGSRGARASLGICDDKHLVVQFVTLWRVSWSACRLGFSACCHVVSADWRQRAMKRAL